MVPSAATEHRARSAPTSIRQPRYAIFAKKRRWTAPFRFAEDGSMTAQENARENNAAQFGSSLVAMVTPMHADGRISQDAVTRLADYLLAAGCDGLVVAGTTGESPTLTPTETAKLIATVARHAGTRARVIAGVGTSDTAHSVDQARRAQEAGADAPPLVATHYSRPTQAWGGAHRLLVPDATAQPRPCSPVPARTCTTLGP